MSPKRSFVIIEAGGIRLTNQQVDSLLSKQAKISPFADAGTQNEEREWYDILLGLAIHPDPSVRECVASNETTHPEILEALSSDPNINVKKEVAGNPSTPSSALRKLFSDKDVAQSVGIHEIIDSPIRQRIMENPSVPLDLLESSYESNEYLFEIASNRSTPPNILGGIVQRSYKADEQAQWRLLVAGNISSPPELLQSLFDTDQDYLHDKIAYELSSNPSTPPDVLSQIAWIPVTPSETRIIERLAKNPSITPETFEKLLNHDFDFSFHLFLNPNCPPHYLELEQTRVEPSQVKEAIARNPKTPRDSLEFLATEKDLQILSSVAGNPNTPSETLSGLYYSHAENYEYPRSTETQNLLMQNLIMNPSMPESVLSEIYLTNLHGLHDEKDHPKSISHVKMVYTNYLVIQWVAMNPSTPNDILRELVIEGGFNTSVARNTKGERFW